MLHVDAVTHRAGIAMITTRCEIAAQWADGPDEPVATVVSTLAVRGEDT